MICGLRSEENSSYDNWKNKDELTGFSERERWNFNGGIQKSQNNPIA